MLRQHMAAGRNHSPLFEAVPDVRRYPRLAGRVETDVLVVGGGIAGVMTAWRLAEHGLSVIVLEQNHLVTGDTGYTTSFVTRVPDTPIRPLAKRYGLQFVTSVFQATRQAQQCLRSIITEEKIDCDWTNCNSYNLSYTANDPALREEWSVVQEADPQSAFVTAADLSAVSSRPNGDPNLRPPQVEGIRFSDEGYFNVRKFIFGLLHRPTANSIKVFEESQVKSINVDRNGVTATTDSGVVRAKRIIITTGLPHQSFSELHGLFTSSITYALAARYDQGAPISPNTFWDTDQPYQYYRRLDDKTIILGGADRPQHQTATALSISPEAKLTAWLDQRFPGPHEVTHTWSGSLFQTEDGLPYIAEHPHYRGKVYVACGFNGSGMVMGTLSGMILGDLAAGKEHEHAHIFDFSRTGVAIPKPEKKKVQQTSVGIKVGRWLLPFAFLAVISIPFYVFFNERGGFDYLQSSDLKSFGLKIFPLVGLYAFTLVWFQLMIGSSMDVLRRVYSWIEGWHRKEGVFVLLFALTHPLLLIIGIGWPAYWAHEYIAPELVIYTWLGLFQLFLICLTTGSALLRKTKLVKKFWRTIHYANYLVFASVWIHSWYLGSDVQHTDLKWLWYFFAVSAIASTFGRIIRARRTQPAPSTISSGTFTTVATVDQVKEGQPFCAVINNQKISVFQFGEKYYAIDNVCSHAGGSLCEGIQMGNTIECPLHQSLFDITTGAVKEGPAVRPQRTYQVRVTGNSIEIAI